MGIILFDGTETQKNLLPLTFTRPVAELRVGILRIREKWAFDFPGEPISFLSPKYLSGKFPAYHQPNQLYINGALCPDPSLCQAILRLNQGQALVQDGCLLAVKTDKEATSPSALENAAASLLKITYAQPVSILTNLWDIFLKNGQEIHRDFARLTTQRVSQPINDVHTIVYQKANVFLEEGVKIRAAIINAEDGPVYLGKNANIMEGAILKGPVAIGEGAEVKMGAKIRPETTIGPFCKAGGEISNSVMLAHSNKGHEGFLGNAIIGEWCNLGADTNCSNLKNNYSPVSIWNYARKGFVNTGLQFCGLTMGDHAKCGINTMFNTGTVVGVFANIFGSGFPPKFIPSFSWGGADGFQVAALEKMLASAEKAMARRGISLEIEDRMIFEEIFRQTQNFRKDMT